MNWEFGAQDTARGYMSSVAYWYQTAPHPVGVKLPDVAHPVSSCGSAGTAVGDDGFV